MKRTILVVAAILMALAGCDGFSLTTPDGDNVDDVARSVSASPTAVARLTTYAMNRYAIEWMLDTFDDDDAVGKLWCHSTSLSKTDSELVEVTELRMTVAHLVECLQSDPETSLLRCIDKIRDLPRFVEEHGEQFESKYGILRDCQYELSQDFNYNNPGKMNPKTWDPNSWDKRELVVMLIGMTADELKSRPALMTALGLTVAGGVIVAVAGSPISLTLCFLSRAIACPDDPGSPGVPQYGGQGGGDR